MLQNLKIYALSILGFMTFLTSIFLAGKRAQRVKDRNKKNEEYIETRERMDEVTKPADADSARDWLRKRSD